MTSESSFSKISRFNIGEFNEYSDHAPLHFFLYCDNKSTDYESYTDVRYKWDSALKDDFRAGIFSNLSHFDNTLRDIDCTNRESINNATCMFTETIRSVADPLFSKSFTYCNNPTFDTSQVLKNADWFDRECKESYRIYQHYLRLFNNDKTDVNRETLCDKRREYKKLIRKKKSLCYKNKMKEIEDMKYRKLGTSGNILNQRNQPIIPIFH